jgi:hypothetical protein
MVKCFESLVTLYRTLIALCGLLIAVGASYHPAISGNPTADLRPFGRLRLLDLYDHLAGRRSLDQFGGVRLASPR